MIATNELLAIGVTLISNFVATVQLPHTAAPTGVEDIKHFNLGFHLAPIDTYLVLRNGDEFWIRNGVVQSFQSANARPTNSAPTGAITSNQVVELAVDVVSRLSKNGNPTVGVAPGVTVFPSSDGTPAVFYRIWWPTKNPKSSFTASVGLEIDARRGQLTNIELQDEGFYDRAFAAQISNRVYTLDPQLKPRARVPLPRPTERQVVEGIASWLELCARLGFNPGAETNLASVNWDQTYCYKDPYRSASNPVCQVRFNNGGGFDSLGGSTFSIYASDACYRRDWGNKPKGYWDKFTGKIARSWEELAGALQAALISRVGLPRDSFEGVTIEPVTLGGKIGDAGIKRVLISWIRGPADDSQRLKMSFIGAEFDLETGELKLLYFGDPRVCESLRQVLAKPRPK